MKLGNIKFLNLMEVFSKSAEFSSILQKSRQKAEMRIIAEHRGM